MTVGDFDRLRQDVFAAHGHGDYRDGLRRIAEYLQAHDESPKIVYWRACLLSLLGETTKALHVLEAGLERGWWWSQEYLTGDPDLEAIRSTDRFRRIVEMSRARRDAATAQPAVRVLQPNVSGTSSSAPLLVALHGHAQSVAAAGAEWGTATTAGWRVALVQSSQVCGPDEYGWEDLELGAEEVTSHMDDLESVASTVVLGGFSRGAAVALRAALRRATAGCVLVAPTVREPQQVLSGGDVQLTELRATIICGDQDPLLDATSQLAELLENSGADCRMSTIGGLAHQFPPDAAAWLPDTLREFTRAR